MVQIGLGYILMLLAMTFNGGIFLTIVAGLGLGYALRPTSVVGGVDPCHGD